MQCFLKWIPVINWIIMILIMEITPIYESFFKINRGHWCPTCSWIVVIMQICALNLQNKYGLLQSFSRKKIIVKSWHYKVIVTNNHSQSLHLLSFNSFLLKMLIQAVYDVCTWYIIALINPSTPLPLYFIYHSPFLGY